MESIISSHNKHILNSNSTEYGCNCNNREECLLENKCLTPTIVYRADLTNNKTDTISDTPFKDRCENHKTSFRQRSHLTTSGLSKYYWKLVDNGAVPAIKSSITKRVKGNSYINKCNLYLSKRLL